MLVQLFESKGLYLGRYLNYGYAKLKAVKMMAKRFHYAANDFSLP